MQTQISSFFARRDGLPSLARRGCFCLPFQTNRKRASFGRKPLALLAARITTRKRESSSSSSSLSVSVLSTPSSCLPRASSSTFSCC